MLFAHQRLLGDAHHHRDTRAVDIGIEQPDLRAGAGQRDRHVDGHRRLADAALAGRNGDHVLDALDRLRVSATLTTGADAMRPGDRRFTSAAKRLADGPFQRVASGMQGRQELNRQRDRAVG